MSDRRDHDFCTVMCFSIILILAILSFIIAIVIDGENISQNRIEIANRYRSSFCGQNATTTDSNFFNATT